ncbi:hypothetical protein V6N13_093351 [Hibiscus sabdariffa]|uniref:Uncharacterized protein n=1 Tax=Hibiscus sabdariffa TaxID=183260 RepID=A0ABR2BMP9_9ROSI
MKELNGLKTTQDPTANMILEEMSHLASHLSTTYSTNLKLSKEVLDDTMEHLSQYNAYMNIMRASNEFKCKLFSTTLHKGAQIGTIPFMTFSCSLSIL